MSLITCHRQCCTEYRMTPTSSSDHSCWRIYHGQIKFTWLLSNASHKSLIVYYSESSPFWFLLYVERCWWWLWWRWWCWYRWWWMMVNRWLHVCCVVRVSSWCLCWRQFLPKKTWKPWTFVPLKTDNPPTSTTKGNILITNVTSGHKDHREKNCLCVHVIVIMASYLSLSLKDCCLRKPGLTVSGQITCHSCKDTP